MLFHPNTLLQLPKNFFKKVLYLTTISICSFPLISFTVISDISHVHRKVHSYPVGVGRCPDPECLPEADECIAWPQTDMGRNAKRSTVMDWATDCISDNPSDTHTHYVQLQNWMWKLRMDYTRLFSFSHTHKYPTRKEWLADCISYRYDNRICYTLKRNGFLHSFRTTVWLIVWSEPHMPRLASTHLVPSTRLWAVRSTWPTQQMAGLLISLA